MSDLPNPGSDEAVKAGCTCPRMDNGYGRGAFGGVTGDDGKPVFYFTEGCPVHSPNPAAGREEDA